MSHGKYTIELPGPTIESDNMSLITDRNVTCTSMYSHGTTIYYEAHVMKVVVNDQTWNMTSHIYNCDYSQLVFHVWAPLVVFQFIEKKPYDILVNVIFGCTCVYLEYASIWASHTMKCNMFANIQVAICIQDHVRKYNVYGMLAAFLHY